MPVYLHCPHCEHPQVIPSRRRGTMQVCRQCGRAYLASETGDGVKALPIPPRWEVLKPPGDRKRVDCPA